MKHKDEIIEIGALMQAWLVEEHDEEKARYFSERLTEKLTDLAANWRGTIGDCVLFDTFIASWYWELSHLFDGVELDGKIKDLGIPHLRDVYDEVQRRLPERIR